MSDQINFNKLSAYKSLEENPGYLLWLVSMQWRRSIEAVLRPLNLTQPQFVVMATLGWLTKNGDKVNQADIGRMTGIDQNTISQILRGLKVKNLLKCTRALDERSKSPELTDLGANLIKQALPIVEQADLQFFSQIKQDEVLKLIIIFNKLFKT